MAADGLFRAYLLKEGGAVSPLRPLAERGRQHVLDLTGKRPRLIRPTRRGFLLLLPVVASVALVGLLSLLGVLLSFVRLGLHPISVLALGAWLATFPMGYRRLLIWADRFLARHPEEVRDDFEIRGASLGLLLHSVQIHMDTEVAWLLLVRWRSTVTRAFREAGLPLPPTR